MLITELLALDPRSPTCHCVVWAGLCPRGSGASCGKAAPALGAGGTGHPTRCGPEGLSREVCVLTCSGHGPHLPVLTHASSHVHTRSCAHLCMHVLCACAYTCPCTFMHTRSCTCAHTCTHACTHMFTAHSHRVWACSHALVHACALTHSSAHVPTHTPSRAALHAHAHLHCMYTNIAHPHPHMYTLTPAVAPGPIPPCQAQAQPTHCETNTGAQGPLGVRLQGAPPGKSWGREQREPRGTAAAPQDTHAATT